MELMKAGQSCPGLSKKNCDEGAIGCRPYPSVSRTHTQMQVCKHEETAHARWAQGFFYRPVGQNRRPPVAINRTGLIGYRKNRTNSKSKLKTHVQPVPIG